jgi:hypothetical protein
MSHSSYSQDLHPEVQPDEMKDNYLLGKVISALRC